MEVEENKQPQGYFQQKQDGHTALQGTKGYTLVSKGGVVV